MYQECFRIFYLFSSVCRSGTCSHRCSPKVDRSSNSWILQLSEIAAFGTTSYRVRLYVKNAPTAGTAYAWKMQLLDATEPFAHVTESAQAHSYFSS